MFFGNLITAMVTPFTKDGQVNYAEAVRLANYLADNGSDTILLAGTTGESPTLTHDEELALFSEVVRGLSGRPTKVMAGTGSNCTKTAIEHSQKAQAVGVDGLLQVVPYYNKPSQEGIYAHFAAVAKAVDLPIMLYNIPGRTAKNMEPQTAADLCKLTNIVAVKEAAGDLVQMKKLVSLVGADIAIYAGDDSLTLDALGVGAKGVVSVAAHFIGKQIAQMISSYNSGDIATAREINDKYQTLFKVLFINTNPVPAKEALNMCGFDCGITRLPLVPLNEQERSEVKRVFDSLSLT